MKKFYILTIAALMAANVMAEESKVVLDLNNVTVPATIEFDGEKWADTYNEAVPAIEVAPFKLTHIIGGTSWDGSYYDGFTICRSGDNVNGGLEHQWGNIAGGGIGSIDGTAVTADATVPYILGYWSAYGSDPSNQITFTDGKTYAVEGMYVCNSTYAYLACKDGGGYNRALNQEGDSYTLTAHGVKATGDGETTVTLEMAGFHDGAFKGIDKWTWWDLSALGEVNKIYFTMNSTDTGDWGINTPTYFVMDRLTVTAVNTGVDRVDTAAEVIGKTYVNVAGQQSAEPFAGVNIVITRYSNGAQKTTKVVF